MTRATTRVYFHYSSTDQVLLDCSSADVADMAEARERANAAARAMMAAGGETDWHDWMLHVSDDLGEMVYSLPFKALIGHLH